MNNLQYFCKELNWQGGTIHQVASELKKHVGSTTLTNVSFLLSCNHNARELLICLYNAKKLGANHE